MSGSDLPQYLHESRNGRLLLAVHATLGVVRGSYSFGVPWVVLQRGAGADVATTMAALALVGYLLSSVPAARMSGGGSRRSLLVFMAVLSAVVVGGIAAWELGHGHAPLVLLAAGVLLLAFASGGLLAASYPAADTLVRPAAMRGAHAQLNTLDQLAGFGAGAVGAGLLEVLSFAQLLLVLTGLALVALASALAINSPLCEVNAGPRPTAVQIRKTLAMPAIRWLFLAGMVWNLGQGAFAATIVAWMQLDLLLSAGESAVLIAASAVGSIASGVLLSHRNLRLATARLLMLALAVNAVFLVATAAVPDRNLVVAVAVVGLLSLVKSSVAALFVTARAELGDPAHRAAVLVTGQALHRIALFVAYLSAAALVVPLGFTALYVGAAVAVACAGASVVVASRRREPAIT